MQSTFRYNTKVLLKLNCFVANNRKERTRKECHITTREENYLIIESWCNWIIPYWGVLIGVSMVSAWNMNECMNFQKTLETLKLQMCKLRDFSSCRKKTFM